ncbi:MAG: ATP-binding protein, partial [Chloroflexota bacterium]|nr:ATP-binding protein [Chloroflexota bacterium]
QSLGDNNRVRDALASGVERLFSVSAYVTVVAPSLRELNTVTERVEEEFERIMAATRRTTFKQDIAFHSVLPEATDGIRAVRNLDTTSVATMIPFTSGGLSTEGGLVWGISPHNRGVVQVNPFDPSLQNYNMTVFAASGSGKSYAIKKGLLNAAYMGLRWLVIDPDGEYRTLVRALHGQLIELAVGSPHHINPLDLPAHSGDDQEMEGLSRHVNELIGWLEIMCAPAEGFTSQEQAVLDRALYDAYQNKGITPDPDTHDNEPPLLKDLLSALRALPGDAAENLAIRLERYVSGSLSGLFNHPTNVDLDSDYIVFDVFGIKDPNQQALALHMVTRFIWRQITGEVRPRILVIDEAWTLMQHAKGGEFLFEFAKKARKRYLAVWTITQDIEDFMNSHHGRAVVNNSSMKLLLRHDTDAAIRAVADVFRLSADDRALLRKADPGDGLFYVRNTHVPIRIVASPDEHALITTKPAELAERQARRREGAVDASGPRSNGRVAGYTR